MIDLKAKPFFLSDSDIGWVQNTLAGMTLAGKARQIFCPMGFTDDDGALRHQVNDIGVGGMMYRSVAEMKQEYDLYAYICNMQNASNNTTLRLNWNVAFGLGDDAPWLTSEIPVLMISTGYPYHLSDAPMIKTYINAYSSDEAFCRAVMEKISGRSEFVGVSPSDPFCGKEWLRPEGGCHGAQSSDL